MTDEADFENFTSMTRLHVRCGAILKKDPSQRLGQAYYNAVRDLFPNGSEMLAKYIDGTGLDPFEDDKRVPAFLYSISKLAGEQSRIGSSDQPLEGPSGSSTAGEAER